MNMFKPTKAKTVKEYISLLPTERREIIDFLHRLIQDTAPTLTPHFAYNMLGYGSFPYKNAKKKMVEWPTIGLASQKNYVSLYICAVKDGKYIAENNKKELGNVSVGKSCIRFRTLGDLNVAALKKVIKAAEKSPGLVGVGASAKKK